MWVPLVLLSAVLYSLLLEKRNTIAYVVMLMRETYTQTFFLKHLSRDIFDNRRDLAFIRRVQRANRTRID